jgi:predicted chitinase
MAGLNNTRQQVLPSLEEARQIVRDSGRDYALVNQETGDVMPMNLMATKNVREFFPKTPSQPVTEAAQPARQPMKQAAAVARKKAGYTSDDYKAAYIKELRQAGYSDRAIGAMMGIAHGETGGFGLEGLVEHGRYTDPQRISGLFGAKKPAIVKQAKKIAAMDEPHQYNALYDGRADLGNVKPGDGYRYRGRGMVHLTGRQAYEAADKALGLKGKLLKNPNLVASDPVIAARSAIAFYQQPGKLGSRRDFGLEDVLPKVGGARSSWDMKRSAADQYTRQLPTLIAGQ